MPARGDRALAQWKRFFPTRRTAPPGGWHAYLRDGWTRGLGEWRARYQLYLRSHAWQQRRAGAIARAGGRCALCAGTSRLQAHHVTYQRVGCEQAEDLRILCESCHRVHHTLIAPPPIRLDPETRRRAELRYLRPAPDPPARIVRRRPQGQKAL